MKTVTVYSTGSCNTETRKGSAEVVLEYQGKHKYLYFQYENVTANRCILLGLIDGVSKLTRPCTVILVSSCQLGEELARRGKGANLDLHRRLKDTLVELNCSASFDSWLGRGEELNKLIHTYR